MQLGMQCKVQRRSIALSAVAPSVPVAALRPPSGPSKSIKLQNAKKMQKRGAPRPIITQTTSTTTTTFLNDDALPTEPLTSTTPSTHRPRSHHPILELINDSTKWAVSTTAFTVLLWRHDFQAAWCVLGGIFAAFNNKVRRVGARGSEQGSGYCQRYWGFSSQRCALGTTTTMQPTPHKCTSIETQYAPSTQSCRPSSL